MMSNYTVILTETGQQKLAAAIANNTTLDLKEIAVGDANGDATYQPVGNETGLINEVWRADIQSSQQTGSGPFYIRVETTIPASDGGWYIREAGIFDTDSDLIAVANWPEAYKPGPSEGAAGDYTVRLIFAVQNADNITIEVDAASNYATQEYVNNYLTGNIITAFKDRDAPDASYPENSASVAAHVLPLSATFSQTKDGVVDLFYGCEYRAEESPFIGWRITKDGVAGDINFHTTSSCAATGAETGFVELNHKAFLTAGNYLIEFYLWSRLGTTVDRGIGNAPPDSPRQKMQVTQF